MPDESSKPVVNFVVLQSVEDYAEKSGKFRTECASFKIPGRDSGGAGTLYIPYCVKQRFDFGPILNEFRGRGVFRPPEIGKAWEIPDFAVYREHFHDIHCPQPCRGYSDSKNVAQLEKPAPSVSKKAEGDGSYVAGKWTKKEIMTALVVPLAFCLVGAVLGWMTPEGRLLLHLDKPQAGSQHSSPTTRPSTPQNDSMPPQVKSATSTKSSETPAANHTKRDKPTADVEPSQRGPSGSQTPAITQGPGSIVQFGGVGNTATVYNAPPQRLLSPDQYAKLVELLRNSGTFKVVVRHAEHNFEAQRYYDDFDKAFREAGWSVVDETNAQLEPEVRQGQGLELCVRDVNKVPPVAAVLQQALKKIGVDAGGVSMKDFGDNDFMFYVGVQ